MALVFAAPLLLLAEPAAAQQDPEGTLFIGYSYLRLNSEGADRGNAHGFEVDYTYHLARRVGFVLTASAHWGEIDAPPNIFNVSRFDARQLTFMAGPHFVLWRGFTSEVGIRALAGVTGRRFDTSVGSIKTLDQWEFTYGASLNLDVRISDKLWWRVLQPSVIFHRFDDDFRHDYRIATGIVIRGGEILQ